MNPTEPNRAFHRHPGTTPGVVDDSCALDFRAAIPKRRDHQRDLRPRLSDGAISRAAETKSKQPMTNVASEQEIAQRFLHDERSSSSLACSISRAKRAQQQKKEQKEQEGGLLLPSKSLEDSISDNFFSVTEKLVEKMRSSSGAATESSPKNRRGSLIFDAMPGEDEVRQASLFPPTTASKTGTAAGPEGLLKIISDNLKSEEEARRRREDSTSLSSSSSSSSASTSTSLASMVMATGGISSRSSSSLERYSAARISNGVSKEHQLLCTLRSAVDLAGCRNSSDTPRAATTTTQHGASFYYGGGIIKKWTENKDAHSGGGSREQQDIELDLFVEDLKPNNNKKTRYTSQRQPTRGGGKSFAAQSA